MRHRTDDIDRERDSNPQPDAEASFSGRLPAYVVGLVVLGFAVFLVVVLLYDGGCSEAAECEGDGELAPLVGAVYGLIACLLGIIAIAVAEAVRFARRR